MPNKTATTITASGRRKTATARVRLIPSKNGEVSVNNQPLEKYFPDPLAQFRWSELFRATNTTGNFAVSVKVSGSGRQGQLGASILALARALAKFDEKFKPLLRKKGFLTRDPRARQRERFGLMGARKEKQSPKR